VDVSFVLLANPWCMETFVNAYTLQNIMGYNYLSNL
jgi:hypothetical protein